MPELIPQFCAAYHAVEQFARAHTDRPITVAEVAGIIRTFPETERGFRRINDELECGLGLDDELIAERLGFPRSFIHELFKLLRASTVGGTIAVAVH